MKNLFLKAFVLMAVSASVITIKAQNNYNIPAGITDGNILHCFSWPMKYITDELPNIAAAGFGTIQISPLQRPDIDEGWTWYTIYLPYDYGVFSSPGMGSKEDLRELCLKADEYGIKIIVDVALNHVNKTEPYYNPWWAAEGRWREWGGAGSNIDYNSRWSITHNRLGDYVELNTENPEVTARSIAFMEELRSLGVKGIRFDAAKHIELPSETNGNGDGIWPAVTSVEGLFYYGEIVGDCVNGSDEAIKEYSKYIWVPDNTYSTRAARENGGVPTAHAGGRDAMTDGHLIYWAESHDDYSNDEWSERLPQGVIDRAYCALACRNTQAALYYSRPRARGKDNIKIEKGSMAFMSKQVVEVNKFRNAMVGRRDYFTKNDNNEAACITREGGGAVIVTKGSNTYVTIQNGGGYCPEGTYTDRVSGNTFTVTSDHISGTVGPTGVAIIYNDYKTTPQPAEVTITGQKKYNVAYSGNFSNGNNYIHYWKDGVDGSGTQWPGVPMERAKGSDGNYYWCYAVPAGMDRIIFNNGGGDDAMQSGDLVLDSKNIMDNGGSTIIPVKFQTGTFEPEPAPVQKSVTIEGDYNVAYSGDFEYIHYWEGSSTSTSTWPGEKMTPVIGSDGNRYMCYKVPGNTTNVIFNNGKTADYDNRKTGDLDYSDKMVMCESGPTSVAVIFTLNGEVVDPQPDAINAIWPTDKYCYFYNKDYWTSPKVWAWVSQSDQTNCGSVESWPGDAMTSTSNKYFWKASKQSVGMIIISNNGGVKAGDRDLSFVNGATYYPDGGHIGGDDNIYSNPDRLYMMGSIDGHIWDTTYDGVVLNKVDDNGLYIAYNVPLSETSSTFNFSTATGSNWDDLNSKAIRFGAPNKDTAISPNSPTHVVRYAGDPGTVGGCESWQIPKGNYDVIVDLYDMTVTLLKTQEAPTIEAQQLAEVQKHTTIDHIKVYQYITVPNNQGKVYGVTVDGDNINLREISVDDVPRLTGDDVRLTDKALVTTTFKNPNDYALEASTASIGTLQGNHTFRGIRSLNPKTENLFKSKVNYYYTLKQGVEVKVPMQTPEGSVTLTTYPETYYLVGDIRDAERATDGKLKDHVTYGNPSFRFHPVFEDIDGTLTPVYTLEVALLNQGDKFTVQTGETPQTRLVYSYDAGELKTDQTLELSAIKDQMYLPGTMMNLTFTLIPDCTNHNDLKLLVTGTPHSETDWTLTLGNDKTSQSGSITSHDNDNPGVISVSTARQNSNGEYFALVHIHAPAGTTEVYYIDEPDSDQNRKAGRKAPEGAAKASKNSDGTYTVTLKQGTGQLTIYADGDDSKAVTYAYSVDSNIPTAVDAVDMDEEFQAEYYTLQGVRVVRPERGIYIRVCNGKATKIKI